MIGKKDKVEVFPQDSTKPTIRKIIEREIVQNSKSPEEALAIVRQTYPRMTLNEILEVAQLEFEKENKRFELNQVSAAILSELAEMARTVEQENPESTLVESLQVLADRGNQRAAMYLKWIKNPKAVEAMRVINEAVNADPYWIQTDVGPKSLRGATFSNLNELVAAYKKSREID